MTRHVALLYSVTVSPGRRLTSAELLAAGRRAGFADLRTVIATGNLLLTADADETEVCARLSGALAAEVGRAIPVFARSAEDFRSLVAANPFPAATTADPALVAVRVMAAEPSPGLLADVAARLRPGESVAASPRAIWAVSPDGLSLSPAIRLINAARAGAGTSRNASALTKILAALNA